MRNQIFALLPPDYSAALQARCKEVPLPVSTALYVPNESPRYAHFMTSGMTSIVTYMSNGEGVEVGIIGSESLVEGLHILGPLNVPTSGFVQVRGSALRMPFSELEAEFKNFEPLRTLILRAIQGQTIVLNQIAACNRLHELEERLARWLLMTRDRVGSPNFELTQEFLAQMIGARRTSVTMAAGTLQRSGLIEYRRGHIKILDPESLEGAACECYPIVRDLVFNLYRT